MASAPLGVGASFPCMASPSPSSAAATPGSNLVSVPVGSGRPHFGSLFCSSVLNGWDFGRVGFRRSLRTGGFALASAISAPNLLLSEEALKKLGDGGGGFSEDEIGLSDVDGFGGIGRRRDVDEGVGSVSEDELAITKLGLPGRLVDILEKRGITHLFPIQRAVLTPALEGRDLIARAKTGTGKTLAFGIPIIKHLIDGDEKASNRRGRLPRVLVLAPTRELAKQVEKEIQESAPDLNTVCVYGGVSYITQQNALSCGVDVVVGTPGRIIDLINSDSLKLGEVAYLVLDEADQMLAVGFEEDIEVILEKLPSQRQSMLFSATMPIWVKKLARKYLNKPLTIDLVGDREEKLAEGIKLFAISATPTSKRTILSDLIMVHAKGGKTIVFTRTKRDADEVSMAIKNSIASEALHGDISQHQRERTLNGFRQGKFTVLVATNVAARGLDIPNVHLVIHYELPNDPETFVHRTGRTGRAGKEGTAILMYTSSQRRTVHSLARDVGCTVQFISPPTVEEVQAAVFDLPEEIAKELLNRPTPPGNTLSKITKLPALQDDAPASDFYGKFSGRDRSVGRQWSTSGRGGSRFSHGRGSGCDFDDDDLFKQGGRGYRTENNWSRSSRSSSNDWRFGGSSRSGRLSSPRDRGFVGGSCFICGQSGHKASECTRKQDY